MEKKTIHEEIFRGHKRYSAYGGSGIWTWGEVQAELSKKNIELQDSDVLQIGFDEGFYEEDNSLDAHYYIAVTRERLETDEELEKRIVFAEASKDRNIARRKDQYLELKKEFG